jgi:hypothetical protein
MTASPLAGFYADDPSAVAAALAYLADPSAPERERKIVNAEVPYAPEGRVPADGLWSESLFGAQSARDPGAWAVIELPVPIFHPGVAPRIATALGLTEAEATAVARERAWLADDGSVRVPPGHPGVSAPLDVKVFDWPPEPGYPTAEMAIAALGLPDEAAYDLWLTEWYRERGIDRAVLLADTKSWEKEAEERTGAPALMKAVAARHQEGAAEAERLFVRYVPVPPVTERPLERRPGGFFVAGAKSRALADLLYRATRLRQLIELDAPPIIVRHERASVEVALEAALAAMAGRAPPVVEPYEGELTSSGEPPDAPRWPVPKLHNDLTEVRGVALQGARRALVDFATATVEIDLETGAILRQWRSPSFALVASLARAGEGPLALYIGGDAWDFSCFDMAASKWLTGPLPPEVPFVFLEVHEVSYLIEVATRRVSRLTDIGDYPTRLLVSPCGRYLFATDKHGEAAVFSADGERQFPIESARGSPLVLYPDGALKLPTYPMELKLDRREEEGLAAFALCEAKDVWRRVQDSGMVEGTKLIFRFAKAVSAACFNRGASEVLVAGEKELLHVSLDPTPRVLARLDLRPLDALFVGEGPPRSRPKPDALNALLYKYGTLPAARGASLDELAARSVASIFDEAKPLGKKRAERLLVSARGASFVSAIPVLQRACTAYRSSGA